MLQLSSNATHERCSHPFKAGYTTPSPPSLAARGSSCEAGKLPRHTTQTRERATPVPLTDHHQIPDPDPYLLRHKECKIQRRPGITRSLHSPLPRPALQPHLEENTRSPSAQITPRVKEGSGERGKEDCTVDSPPVFKGGRTLFRPSAPSSSSSLRHCTNKTPKRA